MIKKALILVISALVLYIAGINAFADTISDFPCGNMQYYVQFDCNVYQTNAPIRILYVFDEIPSNKIKMTIWQNVVNGTTLYGNEQYFVDSQGNRLNYSSLPLCKVYEYYDNSWHISSNYTYWTGQTSYYGGGIYRVQSFNVSGTLNVYDENENNISNPKSIEIITPAGIHESQLPNDPSPNDFPLLTEYPGVAVKSTGIDHMFIEVNYYGDEVSIQESLITGAQVPYWIIQRRQDVYYFLHEPNAEGYVYVDVSKIPFQKTGYYEVVACDFSQNPIDKVRFRLNVQSDNNKIAQINGVINDEIYDHYPNYSVNIKNQNTPIEIVVNDAVIDVANTGNLYKQYNNTTAHKWLRIGDNTIKLRVQSTQNILASVKFTVTRDHVSDDTLDEQTTDPPRSKKPEKPDGFNPIDWIIYIASLIDYYISELLNIFSSSIKSTTGIVSSVTGLFGSLFGYMPKDWITIITISLALGLIMTLTRR